MSAAALLLWAPALSPAAQASSAWDCKAEDRKIKLAVYGSLPARVGLPTVRKLVIEPQNTVPGGTPSGPQMDAEIIAYWQEGRTWSMRIAFREGAGLLTIRTRRDARPADSERPFAGTYRLELPTAELSGRIACGP